MLWEEAYDRLARCRRDPEVWSFIHAYVAMRARRDVYRFGQEVVAEAAQEVCRQAFERFEEARGRETFDGWIMGLYRGMLRDTRRIEGRFAIQDRIDTVEGFDVPGGGDPSDAPPPDQREAISRCIDQLSDRERRVVILRFSHDMSAAQIAAEIGISEGFVRVTQLRAIRRLRVCLGIGTTP